MSLKVTVAKEPHEPQAPQFPRLVSHIPTGTVLLQGATGNRAMVLIPGKGQINYGAGVAGDIWNVVTADNYVPFKGTLRLENK